MKRSKSILICLISCVMMISCTTKSSEPINDIITQIATDKNKTDITVLVKYAFAINEFEKTVERLFPDINIIQVGNYTGDMGIAEYQARLEHGDLTDIVMTWPLDVGKEYWSDRLLDLSAIDASSKYTQKSLAEISAGQDGKLYYLPGPSQVRGIVYNKTLFEERQWKVPTNFNEFIDLCNTIEKSGMRSLQLGLKNSEVLDTAFIGYNFSKCYSSPRSISAISDYNQGKGSFETNFKEGLDNFKYMVDQGVFKTEDLSVDYAEREQMLFDRECAMVEDSVLLARMGNGVAGSSDKFALMPFFNPEVNGDWARLYNVCYIGLNKKLAEEGNKKKYDAAIKLLNYISTPEGQVALAADTEAMFFNLKSTTPPNIPEIVDLIPALTAGRYSVFPTLKIAQNALREGLQGMINQTMSIDDVIKHVDEQNLIPPVVTTEQDIGSAASDFTMIETGNFVTDSMRKEASSDFALFLDNGKDGKYNGKGISARLYKGGITNTDLSRILPDLKRQEKCVLWKITMTGENLLKTLEYSIPVESKAEWFYYFSGLKMKYDPCAAPGSRIKSITDAAGNSIVGSKVYSIAVMDESVPSEYIIDCEQSETLIRDILKQEILTQKIISPANDNRFIFS